MLNAGVLTFNEFVTREPLPLSTIHEAVLEFLRGRDDVVVVGSIAVNAYVSEPRMTQDIDLMSTCAADVVEELHQVLGDRFHIALCIREIGTGKGYRLFQSQENGSRHLVDVRSVAALPNSQRIEGNLVVSPSELVAQKVISSYSRRGQPKAWTDWRDLAVLLLQFPELKAEVGVVSETLRALGAGSNVMNTWCELVAREIIAPNDDDEFN